MWVALIVVIVSAIVLTTGIYEKGVSCNENYEDLPISNSELVDGKYQECEEAKDFVNFGLFAIIIGVAMFATVFILRE